MTKEEILAGESEVLEFKRDVPEQSIKFIKTVVAFANGKGGTIVFGVDDKTHKIVGIKKNEVFQKADRQPVDFVETVEKGRTLFRHDASLLPESAVREAIANAVCHRSYLIPHKVQVALYDDRLEVTSPGTLCRDITLEKMREGMSSVRNKGIAETFIYMRIVETWGSGIPNIYKAMQESGLPEPVMQDFYGDFRMTLYWEKFGTTQSHPIPPNPTQYNPIPPNTVKWNGIFLKY